MNTLLTNIIQNYVNMFIKRISENYNINIKDLNNLLVKEQKNLERKEYYWKKMLNYAKEYNGKLLTPVSEYINAQTKLEFECNEGHKFLQTYSNAQRKHWCPECSDKYVRELYCKHILENATGKKFTKIRPFWLTVGTSRLELDMYNQELKLALEHNGEQHYKQINFFGGKETFALQQTRDLEKARLCKEQDVTLLVVPYYVKEHLIPSYIYELLKNMNIPVVIKLEDIKDNTFIPIKHKKLHLDSIIKDKFGTLISGTPFQNTSIITLKCHKGHEWSTKWSKLKSGSWCHQCGKNVAEDTKIKIANSLKNYNETDKGKIITSISHKKRSTTMSNKRNKIRENIKEKKCKGVCELLKPITEFGIKRDTADGFQSYCKKCQYIAKKKWKEKQNS